MGLNTPPRPPTSQSNWQFKFQSTAYFVVNSYENVDEIMPHVLVYQIPQAAILLEKRPLVKVT